MKRVHTFSAMQGRRLPLVLVLITALATAAGGCAGYGDDDDEDEDQATPPAQTTPRVPQPADATGSVPVERFNEFVDSSRPTFATSALQTAVEFTNAGEGQAATTSVVASEGAEGNSDNASVTVTREGLADDSVRAVRYVIVLDRDADGMWSVRSARRLQRCHPNRGHQDFSPQLCT
jgi:hypothetical protein